MAEITVEQVRAVVEGVSMIRTCLNTRSAGDAARRTVADLGPKQPSLRVVAPEAAQRAPFEEDRRADPVFFILMLATDEHG